MTFAYWMLIAAVMMPYLTIASSKSAGGVDNRAPRPRTGRDSAYIARTERECEAPQIGAIGRPVRALEWLTTDDRNAVPVAIRSRSITVSQCGVSPFRCGYGFSPAASSTA
jgi:hypothetical protein